MSRTWTYNIVYEADPDCSHSWAWGPLTVSGEDTILPLICKVCGREEIRTAHPVAEVAIDEYTITKANAETIRRNYVKPAKP